MNKKGMTTIEIMLWAVGSLAAAIAYAHATFTTYREVAPRLDKIEQKIDTLLEYKGAK